MSVQARISFFENVAFANRTAATAAFAADYSQDVQSMVLYFDTLSPPATTSTPVETSTHPSTRSAAGTAGTRLTAEVPSSMAVQADLTDYRLETTAADDKAVPEPQSASTSLSDTQTEVEEPEAAVPVSSSSVIADATNEPTQRSLAARLRPTKIPLPRQISLPTIRRMKLTPTQAKASTAQAKTSTTEAKQLTAQAPSKRLGLSNKYRVDYRARAKNAGSRLFDYLDSPVYLRHVADAKERNATALANSSEHRPFSM
ncbi:hypothetical protein PHYBOEH_007617 [Phytophthora boehmeriae]|uniref:Uncharacterized protein n=1 Tax=Phytophthora boehmeriae TaxID=109152 RepID=A0A8T1X2Z2_9STRA|nr:hypothetical protein PHYBOEH_007617 [Phytophthora boehmeriae]